MIWLPIMILPLAAFLALVLLFKLPRSGREAVGAALLLGVAGYALQGSPGLPGAPKEAAQDVVSDKAALVDARGEVVDRTIPPSNRWVVIADGMARHGQYANAAQVLLGAVEDDPKNAEAWLALGNALLAHSDGLLTPASLYAYRRAEAAAPGSPGPPFFIGLAMAQSGRLAEGRATWARLLERSPPDAPWRADLSARLQQLDAFIASQGSLPQGR